MQFQLQLFFEAFNQITISAYHIMNIRQSLRKTVVVVVQGCIVVCGEWFNGGYRALWRMGTTMTGHKERFPNAEAPMPPSVVRVGIRYTLILMPCSLCSDTSYSSEDQYDSLSSAAGNQMWSSMALSNGAVCALLTD